MVNLVGWVFNPTIIKEEQPSPEFLSFASLNLKFYPLPMRGTTDIYNFYVK